MDAASLALLIRDVPDFPTAGITFRDITPLLADPVGFRAAVDSLVEPVRDAEIDLVVGVEARGFVFAAPVAHALGAGFIPIRKPGRLPAAVDSVNYDLEYGTGVLEVHRGAIDAGARCLVVDDVLATGGTALGAASLVERQGGDVVAWSFLLELVSLGGRGRLPGDGPIHATVRLEG